MKRRPLLIWTGMRLGRALEGSGINARRTMLKHRGWLTRDARPRELPCVHAMANIYRWRESGLQSCQTDKTLSIMAPERSF